MVLATGCMFIQNDILIMAVVITLAVVFLLVIYALTTKTDFTGCGPYLFCTLSILVICGIFGLTRWLDPNVYAYIGIALFSLYIVYDVQMCASTKLGAQYSVDDYVLAAMNMWEEERTESLAGSPYGFVFRAGLGYRYDTGNLIGIFLGAGVRGTLQMFNDEPSPDQDLRVFMLDIYGRAGIDFNIMDILSINAGLLAGGPVYTGATVIPGAVSSDGYARNGFFIAPFAGISLTY